MKPFVSLAIICGDSGVRTLGRLLESVLYRKGGPLVDEIVVGWNGKDENLDPHVAFVAAPSTEVGSVRIVHKSLEHNEYNVTFKVLRQEWKNNFATARNEVHALCEGEWIMWADADDVIASVDTDLAAINDVAASYGVPPVTPAVSMTLKQFLRGLSWDVSCVHAPYDYEIDANGAVLTRQVMRRIIRHRDNWIWYSQDGVHEVLYSISTMPVKGVFTAGLLNRHYPEGEAAQRMARNRELVESVKPPEGVSTDARYSYDMASIHIQRGAFDAADASIREAIAKAASDEDAYRYRLIRAGINLARGFETPVLQEAFMAISLRPGRPEAYFVAAEAFCLMGKWEACIGFYELGKNKTVDEGEAIDHVYQRTCKPRVQAAVAHCELGHPEEGVKLCEEALSLYKDDTFAKEILKRCKKAVQEKRLRSYIKATAEGLLALGETEALKLLTKVVDLCTLDAEPIQPLVAQGLAALSAARSTKPTGWEEWIKPHLGAGNLVRFCPSPPATSLASFIRVSKAAKTDTYLYDAKQFEEGLGVAWAKRTTTKAHTADILFFAPHAVQKWEPSHAEAYGLGGSETAVIMLAQELVTRGHGVTLLCPGGTKTPQVHKGVVYRGLEYYQEEVRGDGLRAYDVLISCRAPWVLRDPELKIPTWIWHQDNGYGNKWMWCPEVDERSEGSLHVSEWARDGLIRELYGANLEAHVKHKVIGNGIPKEWCLVHTDNPPERDPFKVIYASDPTRGLATLLKLWPRVLEAVPQATLDVYADFQVALALNANRPGELGLPGLQEIQEIQTLLANTPKVTSHGRIGQMELTKRMMSAGVYAYPGGPMPEGFGVALVQAEAAGMYVVAPEVGALPEVLVTNYKTGGMSGTPESFLACLLDYAFKASSGELHRAASREDISQRAWDRHGWDKVADRFEKALGL